MMKLNTKRSKGIIKKHGGQGKGQKMKPKLKSSKENIKKVEGGTRSGASHRFPHAARASGGSELPLKGRPPTPASSERLVPERCVPRGTPHPATMTCLRSTGLAIVRKSALTKSN